MITALIVLISIITVVFVFLALKAHRIEGHQRAAEQAAAERHQGSVARLDNIGGDIQEMKGTLEQKILPSLSVVYQSLAAPDKVTSELLVEKFKQAGLDVAPAADVPPSVGFGVSALGLQVSFYVLYDQSTDDLVFHSFTFSSDVCEAELSQALLELNYNLKGGSVAVRHLADKFVYVVNHVVPLAASKLSSQLIEAEVKRLIYIQKHLEDIFEKHNKKLSVILLPEFIALHNKSAKALLEAKAAAATNSQSGGSAAQPVEASSPSKSAEKAGDA